MTFDRFLFANYKQMKTAPLELGKQVKAKVAGCGEVILTLNVNSHGHPCKLNDVSLVPAFGYSLLLVSKIAEESLKVQFEGTRCDVKRKTSTFATGTLVDNLYVWT